ncbi:MAG: fibrobacter succinogenes major paralogous domain-containing protein [Rikenellaceae bacterium]|nr:fibrobacter succinogenes major paralogous domain-containing protein [Rikenellaceae bacterium]
MRWATTNVDAPETFAAKPEDFGLYYQWGKNVGWSVVGSLISTNGDTTWDKNIVSGEVWESANDPCPDGWQVPSYDDFEALDDDSKVDNTWTALGGINGRLFVDKSTEKSIFLPAVGYRNTDGSAYIQGGDGFYWSSDIGYGYSLLSYGSNTKSDNDYYPFGFAVRCVRK